MTLIHSCFLADILTWEMPDGSSGKEYSKIQDVRDMMLNDPVLTKNPVELATEFAKIVTVASENSSDFVARNGSQSIFSVLESTLPQVTSIESIHRWNTYIYLILLVAFSPATWVHGTCQSAGRSGALSSTRLCSQGTASSAHDREKRPLPGS